MEQELRSLKLEFLRYQLIGSSFCYLHMFVDNLNSDILEYIDNYEYVWPMYLSYNSLKSFGSYIRNNDLDVCGLSDLEINDRLLDNVYVFANYSAKLLYRLFNEFGAENMDMPTYMGFIEYLLSRTENGILTWLICLEYCRICYWQNRDLIEEATLEKEVLLKELRSDNIVGSVLGFINVGVQVDTNVQINTDLPTDPFDDLDFPTDESFFQNHPGVMLLRNFYESVVTEVYRHCNVQLESYNVMTMPESCDSYVKSIDLCGLLSLLTETKFGMCLEYVHRAVPVFKCRWNKITEKMIDAMQCVWNNDCDCDTPSNSDCDTSSDSDCDTPIRVSSDEIRYTFSDLFDNGKNIWSQMWKQMVSTNNHVESCYSGFASAPNSLVKLPGFTDEFFNNLEMAQDIIKLYEENKNNFTVSESDQAIASHIYRLVIDPTTGMPIVPDFSLSGPNGFGYGVVDCAFIISPTFFRYFGVDGSSEMIVGDVYVMKMSRFRMLRYKEDDIDRIQCFYDNDSCLDKDLVDIYMAQCRSAGLWCDPSHSCNRFTYAVLYVKNVNIGESGFDGQVTFEVKLC
jgi:hypothetical protein